MTSALANLPKPSMTLAYPPEMAEAIESAIAENDLSKLNSEQRVSLYRHVCENLGLNYLTQPFGYIKFRDGRIGLYAKRECTDQLRVIHKISIKITGRQMGEGKIYCVYAFASTPDNRTDESMGAVACQGLTGSALANEYMKGETKAKRRVTLSICGLGGFVDESEIETINGAVRIDPSTLTDTTPNLIQNNENNDAPNPQNNISTEGSDMEIGQIVQKVVESIPDIDANNYSVTTNPCIADKVIEFGKKFRGKKFKDITPGQALSYAHFLEESALKDGKPLSASAQEFVRDARAYRDYVNAIANQVNELSQIQEDIAF